MKSSAQVAVNARTRTVITDRVYAARMRSATVSSVKDARSATFAVTVDVVLKTDAMV